MNDPRIAHYRRLAGIVTHAPLLHPLEKAALVAREPLWRRKSAQRQVDEQCRAAESAAALEVDRLLADYEHATVVLAEAVENVSRAAPVRLQGKIDDERNRLDRARAGLADARAGLRVSDFAAVGKAMREVDREMWSVGGSLLLELRGAAIGRDLHAALSQNQAERRTARSDVDRVRRSQGEPEALAASVDAYHLTAGALVLLSQVVQQHDEEEVATGRVARIGADNAMQVLSPHELERFADVGGLDTVKETLRRTAGMHLDRLDDSSAYGIVKQNVLLYGPAGTGKTLVARAFAGEYGLRYLRVTPAAIASPYAHETAQNLRRLFDLARQSRPCLLFLDEVDAFGAARSQTPSAEQREIVTQLVSLLDECRAVPRLIVMAATHNLDVLDASLREDRFETRIPLPLPDPHTRRAILGVHLGRRESAVDQLSLDLDELVQRTAGWNATSVAVLVAVAAQNALGAGRPIGQQELMTAVQEREARDRINLENPVRWDDVVLPDALEKRLRQLMQVVQHPEFAQTLGIAPPSGILLYGPPGTGKTTIAKAMATEVRASFYEVSAAQLLSKWVGESEGRVAQLFATARENRPSIIFIDEIDGLLRRRSAASISPWEERVISQFLVELDGLRTLAGVFLVAATNRIDIIDEAIKDRRLTSLEVPLPDVEGRRKLLEHFFAKVRLSADVDLDQIARATDGLSGADLRRLRDEVGLRALSRGLQQGQSPGDVEISLADYYESLQDLQSALIPD